VFYIYKDYFSRRNDHGKVVDVLYFENEVHGVQNIHVRYINDSVCPKRCVVISRNVAADGIFRRKENVSIRKRILSQNLYRTNIDIVVSYSYGAYQLSVQVDG